ncbi:hypothetical protein HAX54_033239 [Datura stramonium]|uniref:Uncharacterized protein n=1 Tax=Datura stramonium TaxID=4076 RepID=A0ABS8VEL4_DATST|nr:hypothetical protein [Datura stramonium]
MSTFGSSRKSVLDSPPAKGSTEPIVSPRTLSPVLIDNSFFAFIGDEAGVRRPLFGFPPTKESTNVSVKLPQKNKKRGRPSKFGLEPCMFNAPLPAVTTPPTNSVSPQKFISSTTDQSEAISEPASKRSAITPPSTDFVSPK